MTPLLLRIAREKRLLLIPLLVVAIANLVVALGVVVPLSRRVAGSEARETAARTALQRAENERNAVAATERQKRQAEQDLDHFYTRVLPSSLADARRRTYVRLARLADDADLQILGRGESLEDEVQTQTGREPVLRRLQMSMALSGDYSSVRQFLGAVEASDVFVTIDDVTLAEGRDAGGPLNLRLVMSTYFKRARP